MIDCSALLPSVPTNVDAVKPLAVTDVHDSAPQVIEFVPHDIVPDANIVEQLIDVEFIVPVVIDVHDRVPHVILFVPHDIVPVDVNAANVGVAVVRRSCGVSIVNIGSPRVDVTIPVLVEMVTEVTLLNASVHISERAVVELIFRSPIVTAPVKVAPANVGEAAVCRSCGADSVIVPLPAVTEIRFVVPVNTAANGVCPVRPMRSWPLVSGDVVTVPAESTVSIALLR